MYDVYDPSKLWHGLFARTWIGSYQYYTVMRHQHRKQECILSIVYNVSTTIYILGYILSDNIQYM